MIKISTKGDKSPGIITGDFIDNSTNVTINNSLSAFNQFRKLFHSLKTPVRHYFDNKITDFEVLSEQFFGNTYSIGQQITVEGFLSKYLLTHRADFHIPFTQKAGETHITPSSPLSGNIEMQINSHLTQLPVQSFPYATIAGKKKYIYFLYPPNFKSFHLKEDPQKRGKLNENEFVESILNIDKEIQPIILISPTSLTQKTEKYVKITGILNEFDQNIASVFSSRLSDTQSKILHNSFRPYNESIQTLCIDLSEEISRCKFTELKCIESLPATIYAETHFENTEQIKNYDEHIGNRLPNAYPGLHWASFNSHVGKITCGLCDSDVCIITKQFIEFAYYTDIDLVDQKLYENKLIEFRNFIDTFRNNTRRFYKKHTGIEIINIYDFIFDYSKALIFHPKGIKSSKKSQELALKDENYAETMHWLKENSF